MKKIIKSLLLFTFLFSIFLFINRVEAKRMAPPEVEPLIYNGLKFTAPHEHMGFIEAWDNNTGEKLWEKQVYNINIDPSLEADVQWIFITKIEMKNGKLAVTNEHGDKYYVDIDKKEVVKSLTPNNFIKLYLVLGIIAAIIILFIYFIIKKK